MTRSVTLGRSLAPKLNPWHPFPGTSQNSLTGNGFFCLGLGVLLVGFGVVREARARGRGGQRGEEATGPVLKELGSLDHVQK